MNESNLALLEQAGLLRMLMHVAEKPRYIGEMIRSSVNKEGIGSQTLVYNAKRNLLQLGLVIEEIEGVRPFRKIVKITDKGRLVAQKIREVLDIINA